MKTFTVEPYDKDQRGFALPGCRWAVYENGREVEVFKTNSEAKTKKSQMENNDTH